MAATRVQGRWPGRRAVLPVAIVLGFAWIVVQNAWFCDDAWFALKPAWNLASGYGLRSNAIERVQGFTSPLWTLLLAGLLLPGADAYLGTLILSVLLTAAGAWLLLPLGWGGLVGVGLLASSRAYVDYSASGLEGPLAHLLYLLFLRAWFGEGVPRRAAWLGVSAGLLALTRLDLSLLVVPPLLQAFLRPRGPGERRAIALGALPLLCWEVISLVYYGALVPNTAVAKLGGVAMDRRLLLERGWCYLVDSTAWDPLTSVVLVAGLAAAAWRPTRSLLPALGVLAYLAYVIWIGGDYMAGRFLTVPFLGAVVFSVRALARLPRRPAVALAAVLLVGGLVPRDAPIRTGAAFAERDPLAQRPSRFEVVDERLRSYAQTGFLTRLRAGRVTNPAPPPLGPTRYVVTDIGFGAFGVGPSFHAVTLYGLTDPLLARMPPARPGQHRAGHVHRVLPRGYLESLRQERNLLADPRLAPLLDDLWRVTRGPLWTRARWAAILRLHDGTYADTWTLQVEPEAPEAVEATQPRGSSTPPGPDPVR